MEMEEVGGASGAVVPGFRFYPTEQELISFYLHHKLHGTGGPEVDRVIPVVDIYRHEPWELPMVAAEEQWFFFTAQQEREARGGKPNRTTATGYWKATGSPGWVYSTTSSNSNIIGMKKTMVFYKGRAPFGTKTPWKMNEYKATLHHNISDASSSSNIDPPPSIPKLRHEMSVCYITSAGSSRAFDRRPLFLDTVTPPLPPPSHHHPQQQPLQQPQSAAADDDPHHQESSSNTIADDKNNEDDEDDELMISNGSQPFWEWERFNCP